MTAAEIRQRIEEHIREMNKGNVDELDLILAPGVVRHAPPFPDAVGIGAAKELVAPLQTALPDRHEVVHQLVVEGDTSVARMTMTGTHRGPHPALGAATGKKVACDLCWVARWEGQQVAEDWIYADWLGLMQQVGIIPTG